MKERENHRPRTFFYHFQGKLMIHAKSRPLITYLHVQNGFIRLYLKQDTAVRGYPVWSSVLIYCILYRMAVCSSVQRRRVWGALRPKRCDNIIMNYGFSCRHTIICASLLQTFSVINRYRVCFKYMTYYLNGISG